MKNLKCTHISPLMRLINDGWQPLNNDRPAGSHRYYIVTHLKKSGDNEWIRPEVHTWNTVDFYRKKNINRTPMIKPIEI